MKNIYKMLNNVKVDLDLYEKMPETTSEVEPRLFKRRGFHRKLLRGICVAVIITALLVTAAFASGLLKYTTGHNVFTVIENTTLYELPQELKGFLYDSNGKAISAVTGTKFGNYYDKDGNKLSLGDIEKLYKDALGEDSILVSDNTEESSKTKVYYSLEELDDKLNFDAKTPSYLPRGYSFKYAELYVDDNGEISGDYLALTYSDGTSEINIFERIITPETAFEAGAKEIREVYINGATAIIMDNSSINWEQNDISIGIYFDSETTSLELIKIAESVK